MRIARKITDKIRDKLLNSNKVVILYGPRQVGKTTLVREILKTIELKKLEINADEHKYIDVLSGRDLKTLELLVSGYDLLFIDEAQRVPDIGINLKILRDGIPGLKIIVTGSSSFDLANKINEPLTGRTSTQFLYPISLYELSEQYNRFELNERLDEFLIYGMYPELFSIQNSREKEEYLYELTSSYLYKDALQLKNIKHSGKVHDLLRLIAFQIGSQVSVAELGRALGMAKDTVESYINLLEKAFVLFRLPGYSRNLRKEVTKMDKIYFYDLGTRNCIIGNLNPLKYRDDNGKLWENFLIAERKKLLSYKQQKANEYFWRTHTGAELDYVEERGGGLHGFEFKYGKKTRKSHASWNKTYPDATFTCVNSANYLDFVIDDEPVET